METQRTGQDQSASANGANGHLHSMGLNWRQVWLLYCREARAALRERSIVTNSILIPLLLYPFILWVMFTGIMFVEGQTEKFISRVYVREWPTNQLTLKAYLERQTDIRLIDVKNAPVDIEKAIRNGTLEAAIDIMPPKENNRHFAGNFEVHVLYDKSKDRSASALARIERSLDQYRGQWLQREARHRGITPDQWQIFSVSTRNVASDKQMGAFIAGMILPMMFVIMVAIGCLYPAIDCTAGERERHTWETLMSTAANRINIVVAKYLYVTSFGGLAGLLNIAAITVTMKPLFSPLLAKTGENLNFSIPLTAIPIIMIAGILLAGFVAAGMMIFASFASTFKEGQAMVTPFYLLVLLPAMFLQMPGIQFTPVLACIPVVNVTLMVRTAITGQFHWISILVSLGVSILIIMICIRLAAYILRFEDVVSGSFSGGFSRFFKQRVLTRKQPHLTEESN